MRRIVIIAVVAGVVVACGPLHAQIAVEEGNPSATFYWYGVSPGWNYVQIWPLGDWELYGISMSGWETYADGSYGAFWNDSTWVSSSYVANVLTYNKKHDFDYAKIRYTDSPCDLTVLETGTSHWYSYTADGFEGGRTHDIYAFDGPGCDSPELGSWALLLCAGAIGGLVRRRKGG